MSIELHCTRCSKLIRAPDEAGGKRGRCPYCKESVYIPMPPEEGEEFKLAPIDEAEEQRARQLRREAIGYAASVDHETATPPDGAAGGVPAPPPGEVIDLAAEVNAFLVAMRDSRLEDADAVVATLSKAGNRARDYVEGLSVDEMPPEIENLPPPLVQGFLKALVSRLS
ncbi:MAG: hypothetical protein KJ749_02300 [Planctomycetes bacterium]|nr:hypothetical protein [Planctomycetota bacterium]